MPKVLLVSTEVLWDEQKGKPHAGIVESLREVIKAGNQVGLFSIHGEPAWLKTHFPEVIFCPCAYTERNNGAFVDRLLEANKKIDLKYSDLVILGAKNSDFFTAVHKQVLFVRCDWAQAEEKDRAENYGIPLADAALIPNMVRLLESETPWFYEHKADDLSLYALTDAGTLSGNLDAPTRALVDNLRVCLKEGGTRLKLFFQVHLLSSLYMVPEFREVDVWSYYPGSTSDNTGSEVMKDFCDLVRTSYNRRTSGPLFIRHTPSASRHRQTAGDDRTDPTEQINTVRLNPAYEKKLKGKTVAVLDDFLTYGVSLGVAVALLRAAGVKKILCVTMGKFGQRAKTYDIQIKGDPFEPIVDHNYRNFSEATGVHRQQAQLEFVKKFSKKETKK